MPSANGAYVKVYLYLLRCILNTDDIEVSISAIADRLDDTEKDIIRALCYWEKINLISLVRNTNNEIISITINDILKVHYEQNDTYEEVAPTTNTAPVTDESEQESPVAEKSVEISTLNRNFDKPNYSEAQIKQLTNTDEVKWMLNIIEIYLDRLIKPMDLQLILYLYESLGFSAELIMYLYEYCVSKNKKNPAYIEAVALSWAEEGIDTVEKAEAATVLYNNNYNAVNKAFGLNRAPGNVEKQYINKWLNKFNFSIDIIVEACNRTILMTQKPDFKYADKILENWFKKDVKELNQISQLDEEHSKYAASKNSSSAFAPAPKAAVNNRFNAFPQRTYTEEDYSSMEQKLLHKQ
jgi:DnaD/phage-associated family protein